MLARAALFPSPLVHGFTDRNGGVSRGRFESLNLGRRWGDAPEAVAENLRRVAAAAGFAPEDLRLVRQVHGARVWRAAALTPGAEGDALWARASDGPVVVGVMTADCVPVLLADRAATAVAAVHSGWRGTVANAVGAAVAALVDDGVDPNQLVAAVGPCIETAAFEVGEEVAAAFRALPCGAKVVHQQPGARPHVDLVAAVRAQLMAAGVPQDSIERVGGCTWQHPQQYFSYRRDGAGIGQMLAFVGFGR